MTKTELSMDSWEGHTSTTYLSADDLRGETDNFICKEGDITTFQDGQTALVLVLEQVGGEEKFNFRLNKTNAKALKESGVSSPKEAIGKTVTIGTFQTRNPKTQEAMKGLVIQEVN